MVYVMSEELKFNIIKLLEMKDLSTQEKGEFVKVVLKEEGISQREFARRHGLSHSTVQDWVSGRQMKKYYSDKDVTVFGKDITNGESFVSKANNFRKSIPVNEFNFYLSRLLFVLNNDKLVFDAKSKKMLCDFNSEISKRGLL